MSLNSYLVTDAIRPLPGSGWTSKNAANRQDSIAKYKEKLNIPIGQKGYIDPAAFKIKAGFNKDDLVNLQPKRSCVVSKPECVQYNYVIPKEYLQEGIENAKVENQILGNELDELQAEHGDLQQQHGDLQQQHGDLQQQHGDLQQQRDALQQQHGNLQTRLNTAKALLYSGPPPGFVGPPTGDKNLGGGTRHKKPRKRTKTQKRRTTRRLRSKKFPRKCFSLRKREK